MHLLKEGIVFGRIFIQIENSLKIICASPLRHDHNLFYECQTMFEELKNIHLKVEQLYNRVDSPKQEMDEILKELYTLDNQCDDFIARLE